MPRYVLWTALLALPLLLSAIYLARNMKETPTPGMEILLEDGKFSVRRYEDLMLIRAPMGDRGGDGSFRRLFGYISGKNRSSQTIPMTAPVLIDSRESGGSMSFIMPSGMDFKAVPEPTDPSLERIPLRGGKFAVHRFSGGRNAANEARARAALEEWMARKGLSGVDTPLFGYYNPPWIPTWFRRNEVWIRLAGD